MPSIHNSYHLTWSIENFTEILHLKDKFMRTPSFRIPFYMHTKWILSLHPCIEDNDFVLCGLKREQDVNTYAVNTIKYKFFIIGENDMPFFETSGQADFFSDSVTHIRFVRKNSLQSVHYPRNILKLVCEMNPVESIRMDDVGIQEELKCLSDDVTRLYASKDNADLIISTDDSKKLQVHKFVMRSRWPDVKPLLEYPVSELKISGVKSSVLDVFFSYLYSGKLKGSDVSLELIDFANEKYNYLIKHLRTHTSSLHLRTKVTLENKTLVWHIGNISSFGKDSLPFFRVIPLNEIYAQELVIHITSIEDDTGGEYLDISFWFTEFKHSKPILLDCEMILYNTFKSIRTIETSRRERFLFENNSEWHLSSFIRTSFFSNIKNAGSIFELVFHLNMCDYKFFNIIEVTHFEFSTGSRDVCRIDTLASDFYTYTNGNFIYDANVLIGEQTFPCHRSILCARSQVFKHMFDQEEEINGIITVPLPQTDSLIMPNLFRYIYTGSMGALNCSMAKRLFDIAEKLSFHRLQEICRNYIKGYETVYPLPKKSRNIE